MSSKFNILWIDDDQDFTDNLIEEFQNEIQSLALTPQIVIRRQYTLEEAKKIGNKYDLVLVDYNLSEEIYGTNIISKIRSVSMLPDIIFYSSSNLYDITQTEEENNRGNIIEILQNGIYFSKSEQLSEKAIAVIKKIINREEKINGFRGMVLSCVSSFETIVNSILTDGVEKLCEYSNIASYIENEILTDMRNNSNKELLAFTRGIIRENINNLINPQKRYLDHSKRIRIMNRVLEEHKIPPIDYDKYNEEILKLRNALGHRVLEDKDPENMHHAILHNGNVFFLSPEYCLSVRKLIVYWENIFAQKSEELKAIVSTKV